MQGALVEECLSEVREVAKSTGEKLPWLECLPKGIRESEHLAERLRLRGEQAAKAGEFMVEREAEHKNEILTDDDDDEELYKTTRKRMQRAGDRRCRAAGTRQRRRRRHHSETQG